ncbi:MAG: MotA/TolQ/ExbB proton channel family protein [Gammaproteobacteria bacterium]|nr:MotA/TolQ/ExbB proton channel family protein [Gammaproteobacteria bacterium]
MQLIYDTWRFMYEGGIFMAPIGFVFAWGVAIAIERYMKLSKVERQNRRMWAELQPVLEEGQFERAREMTAHSNTEIGTVLSLGLSRHGAARRRDDIEIAMEEGMMEVIPQLERRTHYLGILANISTLLGLLGTVMGLIQAFSQVTGVDPAKRADVLSGAIAVAMNTTAFGLIAGIPLLLLYTFLTTKTGQIVDSLEMASVKTLNLLSEVSRREASKNG